MQKPWFSSLPGGMLVLGLAFVIAGCQGGRCGEHSHPFGSGCACDMGYQRLGDVCVAATSDGDDVEDAAESGDAPDIEPPEADEADPGETPDLADEEPPAELDLNERDDFGEDPLPCTLVERGSISLLTSHFRVLSGKIYALVANTLEIWDASSPSAAKKLGVYESFSSYGQDIFLDGATGYVVDYNYLYILNLGNYAAPSLKGKLGLWNSNAVVCRDTRCYVSRGSYGVTVVDVSAPDNPAELTTYESELSPSGIDLLGNQMFMYSPYGVETAEIGSITNIVTTGHYNGLTGAGQFALANDYLFVADGYEGLKIINAYNVSRMEVKGVYDQNIYGVYGVAVEHDLAVVSASSGVLAIDAGDVDDPRLVGQSAVYGCGMVRIEDGRAYLGCGNYLHVLDVDDCR